MIEPLAALGLVAISAVLVVYAFVVEPGWLDVRRVEVSLPRLPAALDGLVIAHLSDLHVGERMPADPLDRAIDACNDARPDLVVITGDITGHGYEIDEAVEALRPLRVRPAYAVLGNHDYYVGEGRPRALAKALQGLGIVTLRNEVSAYRTGGGRIWLVGLDDPSTGHDDLPRTLADLGPDDYPRVLLTHSPQTVLRLREDEVDLVLAGHTHGGQIYVPVLTTLLLLWAYSRFTHGLYWHGGTAVYVNRGLGSLGVRARFLRRPELTLLTLRSATSRQR